MIYKNDELVSLVKKIEMDAIAKFYFDNSDGVVVYDELVNEYSDRIDAELIRVIANSAEFMFASWADKEPA